MNDLTSKSGSTRPRMVRLMRVFGVLALVAAATLIIHHFRKPPQSQGTFANGENSQPGNTAVGVASNNAAPSQVVSSGGPHESALDRLIRILNDTSLSLEERQKAIIALAQDGSKEAVAALKEALGHSSKEIRLAIAGALGDCHNPDVVPILKDLLRDPDPAIARAAIASLARQDQAGAATALSEFLADPNAPIDLRCAAALALGDSKQPWILDPLSRIAWDHSDPDLTKAALDALGKLDFNDSKSFFQQYLSSPDIPAEMRVDAISALAQVQGDPTALLMQLAQDQNPDVRAAAALALSATEASGNYGDALLSILKNETDPSVRARLYQALVNQGNYDTAAVMAMLQNEKDPFARVAGLDLLSRTARSNQSDPALRNFFAQTGIPELQNIALNGTTMSMRQEAVVALYSLVLGGNQQAIDAMSYVRSQQSQQQAQNAAVQGVKNPGQNTSNPQQNAH